LAATKRARGASQTAVATSRLELWRRPARNTRATDILDSFACANPAADTWQSVPRF
jgi:hypothetical protein